MPSELWAAVGRPFTTAILHVEHDWTLEYIAV